MKKIKNIVVKRGRPFTGTAMTANERVQAMENSLFADGGQRLGTVRINAEASAALATLTEHYGTKRSAIEESLIRQAKRIGASSK